MNSRYFCTHATGFANSGNMDTTHPEANSRTSTATMMRTPIDQWAIMLHIPAMASFSPNSSNMAQSFVLQNLLSAARRLINPLTTTPRARMYQVLNASQAAAGLPALKCFTIEDLQTAPVPAL